MVKQAIIADIDDQTDEKILDGYEFTPDGRTNPYGCRRRTNSILRGLIACRLFP